MIAIPFVVLLLVRLMWLQIRALDAGPRGGHRVDRLDARQSALPADDVLPPVEVCRRCCAMRHPEPIRAAAATAQHRRRASAGAIELMLRRSLPTVFVRVAAAGRRVKRAGRRVTHHVFSWKTFAIIAVVVTVVLVVGVVAKRQREDTDIATGSTRSEALRMQFLQQLFLARALHKELLCVCTEHCAKRRLDGFGVIGPPGRAVDDLQEVEGRAHPQRRDETADDLSATLEPGAEMDGRGGIRGGGRGWSSSSSR